jgi:hypothetical protein
VQHLAQQDLLAQQEIRKRTVIANIHSAANENQESQKDGIEAHQPDQAALSAEEARLVESLYERHSFGKFLSGGVYLLSLSGDPAFQLCFDPALALARWLSDCAAESPLVNVRGVLVSQADSGEVEAFCRQLDRLAAERHFHRPIDPETVEAAAAEPGQARRPQSAIQLDPALASELAILRPPSRALQQSESTPLPIVPLPLELNSQSAASDQAFGASWRSFRSGPIIPSYRNVTSAASASAAAPVPSRPASVSPVPPQPRVRSPPRSPTASASRFSPPASRPRTGGGPGVRHLAPNVDVFDIDYYQAKQGIQVDQAGGH